MPPITAAVISDTPAIAMTPMRALMTSIAGGRCRPRLPFARVRPGTRVLGEDRQVTHRERERREADRDQPDRDRELHPARYVVRPARALEPGHAHVEPVHDEA